MRHVQVLTLNQKLDVLDYRVPEDMAVEVGAVVMVPLGSRQIAGVVWNDDPPPTVISPAKLRAITARIDLPALRPALRKLIDWTAEYYVAQPSAVLRMALASGIGLTHVKTPDEFRSSGVTPARLTPQRAQALASIGAMQGQISALAKYAQVSTAVIRGLITAAALEQVDTRTERTRPALFPDMAIPPLSVEQGAAAEGLRAKVVARVFSPILLDGVTGSGKTEVYFEAIAEALRRGNQALVLLPEIALTQPLLARFKARFGAPPVVWHSEMSPVERRNAFHDIVHGDAQVVIGARSALLLPYAQLGVIIVDEAHETSFKQDEGVPYHARDVAVMRARFESIPVILATATPALETRLQVARGGYDHIKLPNRFGGASMPQISAIDLTKDPPERGRWLSPILVNAIDETLASGEQTLLFLNRRGFAPLTLCRTCGHRFQCPNCSAWMVEHRSMRRLQCHHCGHSLPPPRACPECHDEDSLVACGPGVERIADEAALLFPDARFAVATSDTLSSPAKVEAFVDAMTAGQIDFVIGTQLVTKGYHFPDLTLVGVVDADLGMHGGDLRASERSFQQISQVAGRAGRAQKAGRVFLQTHDPAAPIIKALLSGDAGRFYATELAAREEADAPPFGRYAAVIIAARDQHEAQRFAKQVAERAPRATQIGVFGPAPAPLSMLRGWHRFRLLVHAKRSARLQAYLRAWLGGIDVPRTARLRIDVDPYNFS